jgi:hypothetical protein
MKARELRRGQIVGFHLNGGRRTVGIVLRTGRKWLVVEIIAGDEDPLPQPSGAQKYPNPAQEQCYRTLGQRAYLEAACEYHIELLD